MTTSMTRQHFRALADAIRDSSLADLDKDTIANAVASAVTRFNPRFNWSTFVDAATGTGDYRPARATGHHRAAALAAIAAQKPTGSCDLVMNDVGEEVWRVRCSTCGLVGDVTVAPFVGSDPGTDKLWTDHLTTAHPGVNHE